MRAKREPSKRNSYIKWPSGVFPKYEIAVISRAKSAVHKGEKRRGSSEARTEFTSVITFSLQLP